MEGYYGKYRALVRDTDDPERRGRIRVFCPQVMGQDDHKDNWLDWALPCFSASFFDLPDKDDGVWIEFEQGSTQFPIWVGRWLKGKDKSDSEAPDEAKSDENHPNSRVIFTKDGVKIEFNKEGKVFITAQEIHLTKKDPSDALALASKVKSEIQALRDTVNSLVTTYNGHTHILTGSAPPPSYTLAATAAPTVSAATPPAAVNDVKSTKVKAE